MKYKFMKVWITKYALTRGIIEAEIDEVKNVGYCHAYWIDKNGYKCDSFFHSRYFEKDKESAVAKAEEMRQKKIASLKKQIQNLEKMKFE